VFSPPPGSTRQGQLTPTKRHDTALGRTGTLRLGLLLLVIVLSACSDSFPSAADEPGHQPSLLEALDVEVTSDRYVVRFRDNVADPRALGAELASAHSGEIEATLEHVFPGVVVRLDSVERAEALSRDAQVLYVEQDRLVRTTGPGQSNPGWALDRIDQRGWVLDNNYRYQHTGNDVHLFVIDTGIGDVAAEFGGRLDPLALTLPQASAAGCSLDPYFDDHGHGTRVAAVAAGATRGVAKEVTIHSVKIETCDGGSGHSSSVVMALDWIASVKPGPSVVNFSNSTSSSAVADAMEGLISAGVVVVKGAGNNGVDACGEPANQVLGALIVGAIDANGERSVWQNGSSNWGACIRLFAPGTDVPSVNPDGSPTLRNGTSIASPFVAGTAALVLEENPQAAPSFVRADIEHGATQDSLVTATLNSSPNRLLHSLRTRTWISGATVVSEPGEWSWNANPSGGHGDHSWTHEWFESVNGGPYVQVGTGSQLDLTFPGGYCATHNLRLESTYGSETVTAIRVLQVLNEPCPI
jgi:aqualysin 1